MGNLRSLLLLSFDFGNNGCLVFTHRVQGEPVCVEQSANVLTGFQHDLFQILCFVDARCNLVQLAVEESLKLRVPGLGCQLLGLKERLLGCFLYIVR